MTVLIDTSVWIRWFADVGPLADELDRLLDADLAAGHELVYGELLIGDRGGRRKFLATYQELHQAPTVAHEEVVTFVEARRLHGGGISWIDAHLLASALISRMKLWTADASLGAAAKILGLAYQA
ncbi:MAG TPA: PIN domain-containing protein [Bryobacteraceae bacterium]|jgi:predicted nucleic acid-binding protein|nr:PIN domain-containing protein [Bryobacteraceae bacterium]